MRRSISIALAFGVLAVVLGGCGGGGGGGNDGVLNFTLSSFTVNEDGTSVVAILVSRTGGSGAIGVTVLATDGTADGTDYLANNPITLSWAAGDLTDKTVTVGTTGSGANIEIVNDHNDEPDEFINLALGATTGGAITGLQATATLTIVDDDVAGAAEFASSTFSYGEDGFVFSEITVNRVGGTDGDVSVLVTSTDGTANSDPNSLNEPVDYSPISFTVSWVHGDATPQIVTISIVDDLLPELDETLTVGLSNPTNGLLLGATTSATVTIFDDDFLLQIDNPSPITNGLFGQAMVKVGQRLAVGAPGNASGQGRVYLMDVGDPAGANWFGTLDGGGLSQKFGWAMAFGGSSTLAVGGENAVWNFAGSTFKDSFSLRYSVTNPDQGYGSTVAVLAGRLFVGAPGAQIGGSLEPSGRVYPYDEVAGFANTPIDGVADNQLGAAFGSFGGDLLVGAPGNDGRVLRYDVGALAYVFTLPNPYPLTPDPLFGSAIGTNGTAILVGAPDAHTFAPADGRVYVFDGIAPPQTLLPPGPALANGRFGSNILVLSDGRTCIQQKGAGGSGEGRVLVYDASWTLTGIITDPAPSPSANFGGSMAEFDGALAVAAPNSPALAGSGIIYIVRLP